MRPIRIGKIQFTNILPLYLFFNGDNINVEFVSQVPTGLNKKMLEGSIDMGPISSFSYGENQDHYSLLPNLSISAHGKVRSIFLFTKGKKMKELDGLRIAVTNTSASSVALLRILLEKLEGINPSYIVTEPNFRKMMEETDACLLIGDQAIQASWENQGYTIYDLGEEWVKHTGHSMTFAVWAVRKEVITTRQKELEEIHSRFMCARDEGEYHKELVIRAAQKQLGGDDQFWSSYFQGLCYHLGDKEIRGLQVFYDYAYELNLLSKRVAIHTLSFPTTVIQNKVNNG